MREKAIICDIDNTIINITHRYHLLKGKDTDWEAFLNEDLIRKDTPMQDTIDVINCLNSMYPILFVTGRNSGTKEITEWQIDTYCKLYGKGYKLFMRDDADRETPDAIVKEALYRNLIEPNYDVIVAIDDRPGNIELWQKLGITTFQVEELSKGGGF